MKHILLFYGQQPKSVNAKAAMTRRTLSEHWNNKTVNVRIT